MKKSVAIFGGGPASLALASFLDTDKFKVAIYEQNKTCGRKFLVAGKGGFNLSHAEPMDQFIDRYIPPSFLKDALNLFTNNDLRSWLSELGIETYVGSSNRIFPVKGIKPIQVLNAILKFIISKGVEINYGMRWTGWSSNGYPVINGQTEVKADYNVYAFGGRSWSVTGSDGTWSSYFSAKGVRINDFAPSNCAYEVRWPKSFLKSAEGQPLKNIAILCDDKLQKGELVVTKFGLEGNAIYALSDNLRKQLQAKKSAEIYIDFKPIFSIETIRTKLKDSKSKNSTEFLKKDLKLSKVQIQMIKQMTSKEEFLEKDRLVDVIKRMPIHIVGMAPIDEAISTVGGIPIEELTEYFELKKLEGSFCIGEMVDWDAPTGGYLLQGCFSMGVYLANYMNNSEIKD